MKFYLFAAAAAFAFATPAAAQPAQSHQGHGAHNAQGQAQHGQHGQGHQGHGAGMDHSQHANCCGDKNGNGKMDCCEGKEAAQRPCCAQHQQHGQQGAQQNAPAQPHQH
jgi:hypothetical protein